MSWHYHSTTGADYFVYVPECSVAKSCLTLRSCDCSPPGSSVPGILQARTLEWVTISSSRGSFQPRGRTHISCISCIGRQILYCWATLEAPLCIHLLAIQISFKNFFPQTLSYAASIFQVFIISPIVLFILPFVWRRFEVSEWVSEWVKSLSRVRLFVTSWTVAHQAPPPMGFSRHEYWSGLLITYCSQFCLLPPYLLKAKVKLLVAQLCSISLGVHGL